MIKCPICSSALNEAFRAKVLKKYEVGYRRCGECGFLQTEEPYWLDEAYTDAIAVADTGLVVRNFSLATKLTALLYLCFEPKGAYLDIAGGYGMLVRLMRDSGFDYYWDDKYCQNLLARGFEAEKSVKPFSALTAFEVLEHIHDPINFIQTAMELNGCRTFIFTTELYEGTEPPAQDWWYYVFTTGQHISFYQRKTLEKLADKLNLNFYSLHGLHVLTDKTVRVNLLLRVSTGRLSPLVAFLVKNKLGSLTFADHCMLVEHSEGRLVG